MPNWKKVILSGSNSELNILNVTTALTASGLAYPLTDGTSGQMITTDGSGNLTFDDPSVVKLRATVKNVSGGTLTAGTPVHATGTSGNASEVIAASASVASSMPATYILAEDLTNGAEGNAIVVGELNGLNTSTLTEGDILYVGEDSGFTPTKPTGLNAIQNIAIVKKVDASNGSIEVLGSGRSNDLPNLTRGYAWVGDGSGVPEAVQTSSINAAPQTLDEVTDAGAITTNQINVGAVTGSVYIPTNQTAIWNSSTTGASTQIYSSNPTSTTILFLPNQTSNGGTIMTTNTEASSSAKVKLANGDAVNVNFGVVFATVGNAGAESLLHDRNSFYYNPSTEYLFVEGNISASALIQGGGIAVDGQDVTSAITGGLQGVMEVGSSSSIAITSSADVAISGSGTGSLAYLDLGSGGIIGDPANTSGISISASGHIHTDGNVKAVGDLTGSDAYIDNWGSVSASLDTLNHREADTIKIAQQASNLEYHIPFVFGPSNNTQTSLYFDNTSSPTYNPSTNKLTVVGDLAINDITDVSQSIFDAGQSGGGGGAVPLDSILAVDATTSQSITFDDGATEFTSAKGISFGGGGTDNTIRGVGGINPSMEISTTTDLHISAVETNITGNLRIGNNTNVSSSIFDLETSQNVTEASGTIGNYEFTLVDFQPNGNSTLYNNNNLRFLEGGGLTDNQLTVIQPQDNYDATFLLQAQTTGTGLSRFSYSTTGGQKDMVVGDPANNKVIFTNGVNGLGPGEVIISADTLTIQDGYGVGNKFALPVVSGSAGQVLQMPQSGHTLEWANTGSAGGGTSPTVYVNHSVRTFLNTTEDLYYWFPGDDDYGLLDQIAENLSSIPGSPTLGLLNMGHVVPSGSYDVDLTFVSSMTDGAGNNVSVYNGNSVEVRFYKLDQANGFTQIGTTQNTTMDGTNTSTPQEFSYSMSNITFGVGQKFCVVCKGTQNVSSNTFYMWGYNATLTAV